MKTSSMTGLLLAFFGVSLCLAAPAAGKTAACPPDSVGVGPVCVDKYEASVWDLSAVAATAKTKLIASIKAGTVTETALLAAGAVQRGVGSDDYPCNDNGNDCANIYAVSIAGVTPSRFITWFQAQQAAINSGKRLLANAEWQMAAAGTADPGVSAAGSLDCNTKNGGGAGVDDVVDTGSRSNCVSGFGAFDMVGNLWEWVADWVPLSTACVPELFADDRNCLAGASTTSGPGALVRGGSFGFGTGAGVFALGGGNAPSSASVGIGFRAGSLAAAGKTAACPPDSVRVGPVCVDKYEASVWDLSAVAAKAKTKLIASIKAGTVTEATLTAAGAVQRGVGSDDYACNDDGNNCDEIYAVSIAGVTPSAFITWFQAQQAAANSGKRLLTNAEWQAAAAGTPDPGTDNETTDCNIGGPPFAVTDTGSRSNCVSRFGVFDMVGNLYERVADWVPLSTTCVTALFAGDDNCFAGASTTSGPGALLRGGSFGHGSRAGVFAVFGSATPSSAGNAGGFRAGR